jgi:GT2 family glycosyltransferase
VSFSAVVVLHRSRPFLERLLASLTHLPAPPQLVVVDTGPDDGGAALASDAGASVLLRRDNPGFGAANNAALEHVTTPVSVLVNPDCELLDDGLARLAALASHHPGALHAPRLLDPDGSVQRSAHPLPATAGAYLPALVHPPLLPRVFRDRVEPYRADRPRTVGWAIAACLVARTDLLRALGPFDPAIHLYGEDLDLCLRARGAGVRTVYHPHIRVLHAAGHATSAAFGGEAHALLARTRGEAIERNLGAASRRRDERQQALTFATRIAARRLLRRSADRERAQLAALRAARAQRGAKPRRAGDSEPARRRRRPVNHRDPDWRARVAKVMPKPPRGAR